MSEAWNLSIGAALPDASGEVLIVTAAADKVDGLAQYLSGAGHSTRVIREGEALPAGPGLAPSNIIVLYPPFSGPVSMRSLAGGDVHKDNYVVVVGANDDGIGSISALEQGADYFVDQASGAREILAVVRAIRRRARILRHEHAPVVEYRSAGFRFDVAHNFLYAPSGERARLSLTELAILKMLLEKPKTPLSRETLSVVLPSMEQSKLLRGVDSHVSRLRHKLSHYSDDPLIFTAWGKGYGWVVDVVEVLRDYARLDTSAA